MRPRNWEELLSIDQCCALYDDILYSRRGDGYHYSDFIFTPHKSEQWYILPPNDAAYMNL